MQKDPCRAIQSGVYVWGYLEKNCMLFIIFLAESSIPPRAVDLLLEVLWAQPEVLVLRSQVERRPRHFDAHFAPLERCAQWSKQGRTHAHWRLHLAPTQVLLSKIQQCSLFLWIICSKRCSFVCYFFTAVSATLVSGWTNRIQRPSPWTYQYSLELMQTSSLLSSTKSSLQDIRYTIFIWITILATIFSTPKLPLS